MYQGKFKPRYPHKYGGNVNNICYRSSWELSVMAWCDTNVTISSWSSEETVIPYLSPMDGKMHRYFVDFRITFSSGETYLIEIKPKKQTIPPPAFTATKLTKRKEKQLLKEIVQYVTNQAKWNAAHEYAENNGLKFQIWTEETLSALNMHILHK